MRARTVLYVEDNEDWQGLVQRILSGSGFDVRTTDRAELAIESMMSEDPPDVLVSDLVLVGSFIDGARLLEMARRKGIRAVALSETPRMAPLGCRAIDKGSAFSLRKVLEDLLSGPSPQAA